MVAQALRPPVVQILDTSVSRGSAVGPVTATAGAARSARRVRRLRSPLARWLVRSLAVALTGCASVPMPSTPPPTTALTLAGTSYAAAWYLPPGEPRALLVLQHGFMRSCANLRETTRRLAHDGLMAVCLDADMTRGNPRLADEFASALLAGLQAPDGRPVPARIVVGGHSAGAAFAARVGWRIDALAPERLAGALLLDPVPVEGFTEQLRAVSRGGQRPVLAIAAAADGCNAGQSAFAALRDVRSQALAAGRDGFVGVSFGPGSTHVDVEGEDTDWIGRTVCGAPDPANVERVRDLASRWAAGIAQGTPLQRDVPAGIHEIR